MLDKTAKYSKHVQSIDEEDFIILREILRASIVKESFHNSRRNENSTVFEMVLKGSKPFKMRLPNMISSGDIVRFGDKKRIRVLGREFLKDDGSWKIYGESLWWPK